MTLFRRSKNSTSEPSSGGPEAWAAKARQVDAEVKKQRAESLGDAAVGLAQSPEKGGFKDVGPLSEEYLRFLYSIRVRDGKFVRIGEEIFLSPGPRPGFDDDSLMHRQIIERVLKMPEFKARLEGAEATEPTIAPNGLVDAGKFDLYLVPENEPREDGVKGRFRVSSGSASFGRAEEDGRQKTVEIASRVLGGHMRVEENQFKL